MTRSPLSRRGFLATALAGAGAVLAACVAQRGDIPEARIDESWRRIRAFKAQFAF